MAHYLVQLSYTPASWTAQLKEPKNRIEAVKPVMDKLGGRIVNAYYAFGEDDLVFIADFPNNTSAAAASLVFSAGGAIKSIKTTPLMAIEEGLEAIKKGSEASSVYKPQR
jgi:uncharacterized protein with GYD domain